MILTSCSVVHIVHKGNEDIISKLENVIETIVNTNFNSLAYTFVHTYATTHSYTHSKAHMNTQNIKAVLRGSTVPMLYASLVGYHWSASPSYPLYLPML